MTWWCRRWFGCGTWRQPRCNVPHPLPDIKSMNALVILLLILTGSYFLTQLGKWAIESYYQSAYYYVRVNRNRGRVRR